MDKVRMIVFCTLLFQVRAMAYCTLLFKLDSMQIQSDKSTITLTGYCSNHENHWDKFIIINQST